MGLPDSHGVSRVPRYLGTYQGGPPVFVYGAITLYGSACPAGIQLEDRFVTSRRVRILSKIHPATPRAQRIRPMTYAQFGLFRFRSPLLTESLFALFSSRYLDVSIPSVRLLNLCIQPGIIWVRQMGFPHSEIHGFACVQLTVAYRR